MQHYAIDPPTLRAFVMRASFRRTAPNRDLPLNPPPSRRHTSVQVNARKKAPSFEKMSSGGLGTSARNPQKFCWGGNKMRLPGEQNETALSSLPGGRESLPPQGQGLRRPERSGGRRKTWPCGRAAGSMLPCKTSTRQPTNRRVPSPNPRHFQPRRPRRRHRG